MGYTEEERLEHKIWRRFNKGITEYNLLEDGDHVCARADCDTQSQGSHH